MGLRAAKQIIGTRREILEAFEDFEAGRLGRIERDDR